ncbi:Predicted PurR-regulated permease PerM [Palleronia marisminoris]|uniref:AI-2 transport protein TqsA n=1 Tax=Palleronia marisminoris TaxID=315423 RepID=A0A1Y5T7R1_9RHOB|nr:AI-2E family transporter [Palleronia marisminoris]SFH14517.1 Predicted PurR-regulated permease PerM [Palleronia marisminoris]SLN54379.1 AI-2 transport protein TqsA [Palleronia marisminoris]
MSNETVSADPIDPDTLEVDLARAATVRELQRIRGLLTIAVLIGLTVACFFARDVLLPVILGLMVALTLSPVVRWASRRGVAPPLTAVALVLSLAGVIGAAGYAMSEPVSNWVETAPQMGQEVQRKLAGIFESVEKVQEASDQVEEMATDEDAGVQKVVLDQPGLLNSAASYAASIGATLSVALVLALFILASGDLFYVKIVEAYPLLSEKKRALRIVYGVERAISRYLLTITAINAALGVVVFGALWALGLPNAFIWGFVAFVFNFLPFIGALAGTVLVGFYALVTLDTVGHALLMPAAYMAATSLEGQFFTPSILGRRLNMNTVSVFLTVVFWGWLWGIPGALMAVPFLVIVKVICDNVKSLRTLGSFLGGADTAVAEPESARA